MTKTMNSMALIAGLLLTGASAVDAQTLTPRPETGAYLSVGLGGQPQRRSFGGEGTFPSFGETGRFLINQNVGAGFMFDVAAGYQFWRHLAAGISVWSVRNDSAVSGAASIPDPVFFGRFTTVQPDPRNDLKQTSLGINVQLVYTIPVADIFDLQVSLGPSFIRTKLDVGHINVAPNSTTVTLTTESQSKTTAKAGNLGVDMTYRATEVYNLGLFVRFAGGEVDLPALSKLKVGGVQVGGLVRYRF
jgi:outer membrane protein with beta-barrel domain